MLYFNDLQSASECFRTLSSPARIEILQLLAQRKELNVNALAEELNLTTATVSSHKEAFGLRPHPCPQHPRQTWNPEALFLKRG